MKRIAIFISVQLLAVEVFAAVNTVNITARYNWDTNDVAVGYNATSPVRGFALDITIKGPPADICLPIWDANIVDVNCLWNQWGYKLYPSSIAIDGAGNVVNWGSCNCTSLPAKKITVEMASLYEKGVDPGPPTSGELLRFRVRQWCGDSNVILALNQARGGVVMENPAEPVTVNLTGCTVQGPPCYLGCFPPLHPDCEEWVRVGMPACWCYPRQCYGDADGLAEGKGNFWVYGKDLNILIGAWGKPLPLGSPDICADFDHKAEGKGMFRVYGNDLNILIANWGTTATPSNCP